MTIIQKARYFIPFIILGLLIPSIGINYAFQLSADDVPGDSHFHIFWLSFVTGLVLISIAGISSKKNITTYASLLGLGALTTLPKILRAGEGTIFHDEYAHYKTAEDILLNGEAYAYNSIVNPAPLFTNMHQLVAMLTNFFDTDLWTTAVSLVSIVHILGVFLVYAIVKQLGFKSGSAFVGALIYASNPNWMFFHTQFGYESVGIVFLFAILYIALRVASSNIKNIELAVAPFFILGYLLAGTHHLSSVGLLFILGVITLSHITFRLRGRESKIKNFGVIWASLLGATVVSFSQHASFIGEYLTAPIGRSTGQLGDVLDAILGLDGSDAARTPFEGGTLPLYEVVASFAAIFFFGILLLIAIAHFIPKLDARFRLDKGLLTPTVWGFLVIALLYYPSVLFILTSAGAEGARRSWGYTFLGLAVLATWIWESKFNNDKTYSRKENLHRVIAIMLVVPTIYVGGAAAGLNETYRFPSSPDRNVVSDFSATSESSKQLAAWFKSNAKEETWVLADRYTKLNLVKEGRVQVAPAYTNYPYWDYYFTSDEIEAKDRLVTLTYALGVEYLVFNTKMLDTPTELGFWFARTEPDVDFAPTSALQRLDNLVYMSRAVEIGEFIVYKIEFPRIWLDYAEQNYPKIERPEIKTAKDIINFLEEADATLLDIELLSDASSK
jgi:hypothetical protein